MQNRPVIVDIVRSPMGRGKPGGALSELHPVDLLAQIFQGLLARNDFDPGIVDDLIIGCVSQVGEQSLPPGRSAWLGAGLPMHVPSTTVERRCGSSQQAIHFAAQAIMSGVQDVVIAGGIEVMSRTPLGSARMGKDLYGEGYARRFPDAGAGQGIAAELIAAKWQIGREAMDDYAAASHIRAAATRSSGGFINEIVPVMTPGGLVSQDESIREGTTAQGLAALKCAFESEPMGQRFPQIHWSVTAGNSSQVTDGASAALIMSETRARELGLTPRARFVAFDVIGDDPIYMLTAPIPASQRVLAKAGMKIGDIDQAEVNEAFASVALAWQTELDCDPARLNPRGGAIALGHPLGASGTRIMATLLNGLEQTAGRYGLQTMCEGGGQANATIIERL